MRVKGRICYSIQNAQCLIQPRILSGALRTSSVELLYFGHSFWERSQLCAYHTPDFGVVKREFFMIVGQYSTDADKIV